MKSRRGGRNRIPRSVLKGRKILDDIDGSDHFERDKDMFKQRGLNVHKTNFDSLTNEERERSIRR